MRDQKRGSRVRVKNIIERWRHGKKKKENKRMKLKMGND